jgi:hypothetical protein
MTERQMSRRRAIFCGVPVVSGIGGTSPHGRSAVRHSARFASS